MLLDEDTKSKRRKNKRHQLPLIFTFVMRAVVLNILTIVWPGCCWCGCKILLLFIKLL